MSSATTADSYLAAVKNRRTIYELKSTSSISDARIKDVIGQALLHTPSTFNSQSTRIVVLLGNEHNKLWEGITKPAIKAIMPAEGWPTTEQKLTGFANAYGTVLFYEDEDVVSALQKEWAIVADKFPQWAEHTNAMHQHVVWTALELEGLAASLQHYNPIIDAQIAAEWKVPQSWSLKAQMVFGEPAGSAGEKTFQPLEERLFIHGGK